MQIILMKGKQKVKSPEEIEEEQKREEEKLKFEVPEWIKILKKLRELYSQ